MKRIQKIEQTQDGAQETLAFEARVFEGGLLRESVREWAAKQTEL